MIRFCFITVIFLCCSFHAFSQTKAYDLSFEQTEIALGEIVKGEKAEGAFKFKNTGAQALRIELVSACECTSLEWTRGNIQPNEIGVVEFVFDSSKKEVDEVIDIDIYFENVDPETDEPIFKIVSYNYTLVE